MSPRNLACLAFAYLVGFFLTFGYTYANFSCDRPYTIEYMCGMDRDLGPIFKAIIWPIYWAGYGSIKLFD